MNVSKQGILPKNFNLNDKYKVLLFIKRGSYAETYRVRGSEGKLYFLKLFHYAKLNRSAFDDNHNLLEIELLKNIRHENIVGYRDSGGIIVEGKKYGYLVLDFIAGETLADFVIKEPISSVYDIKQFAKGILRGLDYIHTLPEPVIHNEITPHNIMLDLSGDIPKAVIIDFGYARKYYQSSKHFNKEGLNLNYIATEAFNNILSPQSDLFSVGALMYHLLFGMPPWFKEISKYKMNLVQAEEIIIQERKKPLSFPNIENQLVDFEDSILPILSRALHADVDLRFQSAKEFIKALEDGIESLGEVAKTTTLEDSDTNSTEIPLKKGDGFGAIAGMHELKEQLKHDVIDVLENPEEYKKHNIGLPNGMLLYGPPGCGKTFFAERFAEEAGYNFIKVVSSDLASIYIHGSQEKIGKLFKEAREKAPTILYFDELDAMIPCRDKVNNQSQSGEVNEFLSQLDNIGDSGVFVIGSTNKPDSIDKAALRAGRLEKWFYISPPDHEARAAMFELYLKNRPTEIGIDYNRLATLTANYVSSDIKLLIDEASRKTIRDKAKRISMETLEYIIQKQRPTVPFSELTKYEEIRKKIEEGVHEAATNDKPSIGFRI